MSSAGGFTQRLGARPAALAAAAALALCVVLLALQPLAGFDSWWHLASGREMARRGELLREDPFTYGAEGKPWLNHEWLWQLGAWTVFDQAGSESGGASALTVANSLLLAVAFVLGFSAMSRGGVSPTVAFLAGLGSAWGASPRFLARPEAATLLLLSMALWHLTRPRSGRWSMLRSLETAAPIGLGAALGANLHPGVLAILAVCAAHFAGRWFDALLARGPAAAVHAETAKHDLQVGQAVPAADSPGDVARTGALTLIAGLLGSALNPAGFGLWKVPFELSGIVRTERYFNPEWLPATPVNAPALYVAFAVAAGLVALAWLRARSVDLSTLIPAVALGLLAASGYRHIGLFFVALPFALARPVSALGMGFKWGRNRDRFRGRGLLPVLAAAGACLAAIALFRPPALGVDRTTTPVDAVRFLESSGASGRLYNDVRFGGYLDWRFPEGRRVLLDGRNELFVPLMTELAGIYSGASPWQAWEQFVRRERIEGAVVRYLEQMKGVTYPAEAGQPPRTGYRAYSAYLFPRESWALVYWDDSALVFLRKGGPNEAIIRGSAYEAISPEDSRFQLERAATDLDFRAMLQRDIARRMASEPASARAREIGESLEDMGG